jgi:ADP-heptose:LPS heptosyltransferase
VKIRKILFIRSDRIGDFLLNLPAIHALKETFPSAEISVVVDPNVRELILCHPDIAQSIPFRMPSPLSAIESKKEWFFLFRRLNKEKFDLAIVSNPHKYFHLLTALLRIPCRVGYNRKWGCLLTHTIQERKKNNRHEVEYNLDLVSLIGAKLRDPFSENSYMIYLPPPEEKSFMEFIEAEGITSQKRWIVIHPFTTDPKKEWPMERWAEFLNRLTEWNLASGNLLEIILIGGQEEKASLLLFGEILSKTDQRSLKNLVGMLALRQLAALLKKAALLLSNDSGPVHIAAAFQTETIVLFGGGSSAERWGPWSRLKKEGKNRHTIIQRERMSDIPVETVWKEVIRKFQSSS